MNASTQAEREDVLRRLEQQRQRIDALLGKPGAPHTGLARAMQGGFPRSQTMRLLVSEPVFVAGLSALTSRLFGPRAMQLLRVLTSAFRAMQNVRPQHKPQPP